MQSLNDLRFFGGLKASQYHLGYEKVSSDGNVAGTESRRIFTSSNGYLQFPNLGQKGLISQTTYSVLYRGWFGYVNIRTKRWSLDKNHGKNDERNQFGTERTIVVASTSLSIAIEMRCRRAWGHPVRSLACYQILPDDSPFIPMRFNITAEELQDAFMQNRVSPFARDVSGNTLLHAASLPGNIDVCSLLIGLGADADAVNINGYKPWHLLHLHPNRAPDGKVHALSELDALRILRVGDYDITRDDMENWLKPNRQLYSIQQRQPQTLDFGIKSFHTDNDDDARAKRTFVLHTALSRAAVDEDGWIRWEPLIRKVLRYRPFLHESCCILNGPIGEPVRFYNSLDALFLNVRAEAASFASERWLCILADGGYDVRDYLRQEMLLRPKPYLTLGYWCYHANGDTWRSLAFDCGPKPSVLCEMCIESDSPGALVRQEFSSLCHCMTGTCSVQDISWTTLNDGLTFEDVEACKWPFAYSYWWDYTMKSYSKTASSNDIYEDWCARAEVEELRAKRSWEK